MMASRSNSRGQAFLMSKTLSTLVAMGTSKPKTLNKLENALSIRPCMKVTPYINPLDAIDIVHKLADDTLSVRIQNGLEYVLVNRSEVDKAVLRFIRMSAAVSGRLIVKTSPEVGKQYFTKIAHQICSFLAQKQERTEGKLQILRDLADQTVLIADCEPKDVVVQLQKLVYLKITDGGMIAYSFPSEEQMEYLRDFLIPHLTPQDDATSACYDSLCSDEFQELINWDQKSSDFRIPDLRVLLMLYDTSPERRPQLLPALLKEIAGACKVLYVVLPSKIIGDKDYTKYVTCRTVGKKVKVAIGVKGKRIEDMELSPAGILGIQANNIGKSTSEELSCEKDRVESADEDSDDDKQTRKHVTMRRRAVTRGKQFCEAMIKMAKVTSHQQGSTLVGASNAEKRDMIRKLESLLESLKANDVNQMDLDDSNLPTRKQIWHNLIKCCIGTTRDVKPSTLVLELQKMGWLGIDSTYPHKVTYNLPNTSKNATWVRESEKVMRKTRMLYVPYMHSMIPSPDHDEIAEGPDDNDGNRKRKHRQCRRSSGHRKNGHKFGRRHGHRKQRR